LALACTVSRGFAKSAGSTGEKKEVRKEKGKGQMGRGKKEREADGGDG